MIKNKKCDVCGKDNQIMKGMNCDKLILAVVQGNEYHDVISELKEHGFYTTILQSQGGFLRQRSTTIMIGINYKYIDEVIYIMKKHGEHIENRYEAFQTAGACPPIAAMSAVPISVHCGGVILFILNVEQFKKY